ncbi:MAG: hypothetical protein FJ029_14685, partial [Actinobacteria bacterium]|nr:hypothetical protein [Actinomycetota bacterium]
MTRQAVSRRRVLAAGAGALLGGVVTTVGVAAAAAPIASAPPLTRPKPIPGWTNLTTAVRPPARLEPTLTYMPSVHALLLFGGRRTDAFNDTWTYSLVSNQWAQLAINAPRARWSHVAAWHPDARRVLVHGGRHDHGFWDDTWAFDPAANAWSRVLTGAGGPLGRGGHGTAITPAGDFHISHGFASDRYFDDTWVLRDSAWSDVSPAVRPRGRALHQCVWDAVRSRLLLLFGTSEGALYHNDTWAFDPGQGRWSQLTTGPRPPGRQMHAAVFEPLRGVAVVLGGKVQNVNVTDAWTLDRDDRWTNVSPIPGLSPRFGHAATVDPATGLIYLFGGET